jgi:prepilin-type N-terminal cleavage/methylation domain-containing protein
MNGYAFSLIELSIVLVILGLLTGGILAGKSLIRSAAMRSVVTDYQRYYTAARAFRDKYFMAPGDISNATFFWGTATVCPGYLAADVRTDQRTCNGNGNGRVENSNSASNEIFGMWQHLANAGLIEGQYTGITGDPSYGAYYGIGFTPGVNAPKSKMGANITWGVAYLGEIPISDSNDIEGSYGNALFFGIATNNTMPWNGPTIGSPLKPEEAWNIDAKLDDGKAGTGIVVVPEVPSNTYCYLLADGSAGSGSTTVARTDIQYNVSYGSPGCALLFKNFI